MDVRATVFLLAELAVLFFAVTFLVQLFQRRMGSERVRAWMGGPPLVAALKGIAIGFVTPFCTFTAVPMLVGLRRAGVPAAGSVAFIVAAPVLDPVLFGALVIIVGLKASLLYVAVAFVAALTLAMVADRIGIERHLKPVEVKALVPAGNATSALPKPSETDDSNESACASDQDRPWGGLRSEVPVAAGAAASLLRVMGPILLVGVAISLVIDAAVPPEVMSRLTGADPNVAIPIAAALGTPLYVSTGVFIPIADSLLGAGVGIGAIVALTIAGAGANIPEFVILSKLAKPRVIAIFFAYVFSVAVIGGLLAQLTVAA